MAETPRTRLVWEEGLTRQAASGSKFLVLKAHGTEYMLKYLLKYVGA